MKKVLLKIAGILKTVFGYGIMICLLAGGLTFFGYLAALIIGGDVATAVCLFISDKINPVLVIISTSMILLGLISMYITGDASRKKKKPMPPESGTGENS